MFLSRKFSFTLLALSSLFLFMMACTPDPEPEPEPDVKTFEGLMINEFLAANDSCCADPQGDFDDWLEVYNSSNAAMDIGGLYLTDTPGDSKPYQIPETDPSATTIPAGGYLVIWWDDDQLSGPLHISKKLSASGESIILMQSDGATVVDSYTFGEQTADVSTGRNKDNKDEWLSFTTPTPGTENIE